MPSGLEADLPEGLAIEDIVRLLKGLNDELEASCLR